MREKLEELHRLLHEAYVHYFTYGDGSCKSSEGSIVLDYGNYWNRYYSDDPMGNPSVKVYSYIFCRDGRRQWFDTIDEALEEVREWHRIEMSTIYDKNGYAIERDGKPVWQGEW